MMNEVVYLNERKVNPNMFEADLDTMNVWYLDNGASNHMSGNRLFFYELDETILGKVRFGDDSRIDIKGKGSVRFVFKDGEKKVLSNVYYIPGLRSNIVSLGQATEVGCEVRMKDETLTLLDRNGRLMVKTTRSKNRLYKVVLQADQEHCLQVASTSGTSIWHARLGHINGEKLKTMINKELVAGVPKLSSSREETCVPCLLGKQTRRPFPQATQYRASKPLELIHGDLCGPISPPTHAQKRYIFVLIDDHKRYDLLCFSHRHHPHCERHHCNPQASSLYHAQSTNQESMFLANTITPVLMQLCDTPWAPACIDSANQQRMTSPAGYATSSGDSQCFVDT